MNMNTLKDKLQIYCNNCILKLVVTVSTLYYDIIRYSNANRMVLSKRKGDDCGKEARDSINPSEFSNEIYWFLFFRHNLICPEYTSID